MPVKTTAPTRLPQWNLKDLLANPDKDIETISRSLNKKITALEKLRPSLKDHTSPKTFLKGLSLIEEIAALSSQLGAYSSLWFAQNTTNQKARAFDATVKDRLANVANRVLFFDLWWQKLPAKSAKQLLANTESIRYYLTSLRRLTPHTLTEPEERIINIKNITGRSALDTLYDVLTNALTFTSPDKETQTPLSREQLSSFFRHPSPRIRQHAYQELLKVYSGHADMLGEIYKSLVIDWKNEGIDLRHHASPVAVRNTYNDIPNEAVTTLLACCRKNRHIFQEFFRLKAKICKIKKLSRYDIYAPTKSAKISYPFEEAKKLVFNAYQGFSPKLATLAQQVFDDRHIDAGTTPGKAGGAFCYSVLPKLTPYVMLNYTGDARDVATLAHELGHAVHGMLARHHSIFTFHSTLPLAETASVFGEQLLSQALLQEVSNPRMKQRLLLGQLDDLYATILRQAYFVEFENQAHQLIAQGATVDGLANTYQSLLKEQFGRAVTIPAEFQWEWITIPHIYRSPFYCYAYSFGNLLVLALYQRYQKEGKSFIPKYLELLSGGGSKSPQDLLKPLKLDMCAETFWQSGFDRIEAIVGDLEKTIR
jgi:oligoendopeptidase F